MKVLLFIYFALIFINPSSAVQMSPIFDQDICLLHIHPRGEPKAMIPITQCPEGYEAIGDSCWPNCPKGREGNRPGWYGRCYDICPQGFVRDDYFSCVRKVKSKWEDTYYK